VEREGKFKFVAIPFSPRKIWGAKPYFSVSGTINEKAVRGTLGALGQDYFLRLSAAWLQGSGINPGNQVSVTLSLEEPHWDNPAPDNTASLFISLQWQG